MDANGNTYFKSQELFRHFTLHELGRTIVAVSVPARKASLKMRSSCAFLSNVMKEIEC